ncbi:outer membrane beta-barrel protein [Acidithiobacillus caldus]
MPKTIPLIATSLSLPFLLFTPPALAAVLPAMPPSINIHAGPLGQVQVGGLFAFAGRAQSNVYPGASGPAGKTFSAAVSDALISISKDTGTWQFYLEGGAYNFYVVGQPPSSTGNIINATFGPLPLAYVQYTPSKNFNIQIGKLPAIPGITPLTALISDSYDIEFGLTGAQQQTITRGIQANYTLGPVSASLAWTDGPYSNRYNWAVGQIAYSVSKASTVIAQAGGNLGRTGYSTSAASSYLNNSDFYLLGYNYSGNRWNVFGYLQYQKLLATRRGGRSHGDQYGASIDANYAFTPHYSLSTRVDYIAYSDQAAVANPNNGMGYGPGSRAVSLTLSPIYQYKHWFAEGDLSYVHVYHYQTGDVFGQNGTAPNQFVAMVNVGFLL